MAVLQVLLWLLTACLCLGNFTEAADQLTEPLPRMTYRHFTVQESDGVVVGTVPVEESRTPRWAREVPLTAAMWPAPSGEPFFHVPIPFVIPPADAGEPFHAHNHQPAVTWLSNGDLLAIWYSTGRETGTELTVLASRLRAGQAKWDPASEFFKTPGHNMHGSSIFHDGSGGVFHINGMGPEGATGWSRLALLLRTSRDNGVTWSTARPISSGAAYQQRHQVIAGTFLTSEGVLVQACDATPEGEGPTALHLSRDGGQSWSDAGGDIRGIHAGVAELTGGRLIAFGRGQALDGRMPVSVSADLGKSWTSAPSPFPPIGGGQRLVLKRLQEGPLLLISFTSGDRRDPEAQGMTFLREDGTEFTGHGMFAALSFDDGATWPLRKLLTPGTGDFDGGAWTGRFRASPTRAEHAGYLAATQSPDGVIHLISSRLHYRFNLAWLQSAIPSEVRTKP